MEEQKIIVLEANPCYSIDQGGGKSACVILADVSPTLTTTHYGAPAVCYEDTTKMTYQKISGTLSANAHGSYSTQDALGDLLITDVLHRKRTSTTDISTRTSRDAELYARSASRNFEGGGVRNLT